MLQALAKRYRQEAQGKLVIREISKTDSLEVLGPLNKPIDFNFVSFICQYQHFLNLMLKKLIFSYFRGFGVLGL